MTDNRTTELRAKLTERGIDYEVKDLPNIKFFHDTRWNANGVLWCYTELVGATTCLTMCNEWKDCTPEQAIAATLGDEAPKKCSTCQYRYVVGQRPYPTFGYMCGFGDGKKLCGRDTGVLDHMCCEHWEKELR